MYKTSNVQISPLKRLYTLFLCVAVLLATNDIHARSSKDLSNIILQVLDMETGEPLIAVSVFSESQKFSGITDYEGKIGIPDGLGYREKITFSYLGYETIVIPYFEIRKNKKRIIEMVPEQNFLDSIVVVGRRDDAVEEIPYVVDRVTRKEIFFRNAQTSADALESAGEVFIQKSQMGGGSPIIRGFEANRVLLVADGVRMNNAIYRSGHLQNSITLDNAILDQIEVIYGPGSLMYGSDALGGVVHYRTRDPKVLRFSKLESKNEIGAYIRYASANAEKTGHIDMDYRSDNWASMTSLSFSNYGDLRTGKNRPAEFPNMGSRPYSAIRSQGVDLIQGPWESDEIMRSTGYSQFDLLQKVKYQPSDSLYFVLNVQYSTSSDIPRFDNLQDTLSTARDLKWSDWYYGPQKRLLTSFKVRTLKPNKLYHKGTFIAAFQKLDEDRIKRKFAGTRRTFNTEEVAVFSFTADFDKQLGKTGRTVLSYGLDASHNQVFSSAGKITMATGKVSTRGVFTRYPSGGSTMTSYGSYLNLKLQSKDSVFVFNSGIRYSGVGLHVLYDSTDLDLINWPEAYVTTGIRTNNSDLTWGLGLTINTKSGFHLRALASSAFRSPNIDDFAKLRVKKQYAVLPNTNLKPEKSINGEFTIGQTIGRKGIGNTNLYISGTGFYTKLSNAISRRLGTQPNGDSTIIVENEPNPLFIVQQNFNDKDAFVYGYSANMVFNIKDSWKFKAGVSKTIGKSKYILEAKGDYPEKEIYLPFAHIPPMYGKFGVMFKKEIFQIEGLVKFVGRKKLEEYAATSASYDDDGNIVYKRGGTSDNLEYTPFILDEDGDPLHVGSLDWMTYNLYSSLKLGESITINLAVENILDTHYLPFASGISGAGRNFVVTLKGQF